MLKTNSTLASGLALTLLTALPGWGGTRATRLVDGPTQRVAGQTVTTWARVTSGGKVAQVGVTLPVALVKNPPARPGRGPLGAISVLGFPRVARNTTFFDHFELHWNPNGHPPACCQGVPHFDLHFYGVKPRSVWRVTPHDPAPPTADRLPAGYFYPGPNECVPQMGVHAMLTQDAAPGHKMTANMVAGFWDGRMTFIEPMVTRVKLLERKSFTLSVPRPKTLGRHTRYPTTFTAAYDAKSDCYQLTFGGFRSTQ